MDHIRNFAGVVASRDGFVIHAGRLHTSSLDSGARGRADSSHPRQTSRRVKVSALECHLVSAGQRFSC